MKLKSDQIKKFSRYLEIFGVSIIIIYVSVGLYAYINTDCSYSFFCTVLEEVFADKSTEGNNYIVSIFDGVGTQEILR